jgi:hypothetical protein
MIRTPLVPVWSSYFWFSSQLLTCSRDPKILVAAKLVSIHFAVYVTRRFMFVLTVGRPWTLTWLRKTLSVTVSSSIWLPSNVWWRVGVQITSSSVYNYLQSPGIFSFIYTNMFIPSSQTSSVCLRSQVFTAVKVLHCELLDCDTVQSWQLPEFRRKLRSRSSVFVIRC